MILDYLDSKNGNYCKICDSHQIKASLQTECSWVGFAGTALSLFRFTDTAAVFDDGVEVAGLVLDAVVVVVQVVDVVHVVMVQICSL